MIQNSFELGERATVQPTNKHFVDDGGDLDSDDIAAAGDGKVFWLVAHLASPFVDPPHGGVFTPRGLARNPHLA